MDTIDWMFYGGVTVLVTASVVLAYTGTFGGIPPVTSPFAFVFGQGLWILWHGLLLGSLLAFSIGLLLAVIVSADEVFIAFILLLVSLAVLLAISLVNSFLWVTTAYQAASWTMKYLGGPALVLAAWLALLVLIFVFNQVLSFILFSGVVGVVGAWLVGSGIVLLNLFAIHCYQHIQPP